MRRKGNQILKHAKQISCAWLGAIVKSATCLQILNQFCLLVMEKLMIVERDRVEIGEELTPCYVKDSTTATKSQFPCLMGFEVFCLKEAIHT